MYSADIKKLPRHFLPKDFTVTTWEKLEPFFIDLLERKIDSKRDLEKWLKDISELEAVLSEDGCWRQIRMTCDTESKELENAFTFFMMEIQPKAQPYADKLNRNLKIDTPKFFGVDVTYTPAQNGVKLYRVTYASVIPERGPRRRRGGARAAA